MSNPWAQSFEELRSPYLQEKKAKKDYDGDGKVESGAKEYRGVVHNKIQKAKGGKADGQDTSSVKEHHQKDADGNTIPHEGEGDGTPSSVEEMAKKFGPGGDPIKKSGFVDKALEKLKNNIPVKKVDKAHYEPEGEVVDEAKIDKIDPKNKRKRRNEVSFGKQTKPYDPPGKAYKNEMGKFLQKQRKQEHDKKRGVKTKGMGEEISYTAAYLPSNVDEAKVDQGMSTAQKRKARNERSGREDKPFRSMSKTRVSKFNQGMRKDDHESKRGVKKEKGKMTLQDRAGKMRGMSRDNALKNIMSKSTSVKKDGNNLAFSHYEPDGDVISEADKKGKGSGTKDACYHKVKSRYSVWPSAYASGALVKCRKAGAKNWGNSSKKEEFDYYQMPMKSFGDMVGECWKTHKKVGMKMKGGKMVPDCRPKNESVEEAVKNPKLDIKETGVKNKIEINPEIKTEAAKAPVKK